MQDQHYLMHLLDKGMALNKNRQFKEAGAIFEQILQIEPEHFDALHRLGAVMAHARHFPKALALLKKALAIKQTNASVFFNCAIVYHELRQLEMAIVYYDKALEIKADFAEAKAYRTLAQAQIAHLAAVNDQLEALKKPPDSPFNRPAKEGYRRGIDFYSAADLTIALCNIFARYKNQFGVYPDLVNPQGFNEKMQWSKFFAEMKVPESGNKLLVSRFIPEDLNDKISPPTIVWHAALAKLPPNEHIKPGYYYLKSNHGSGMFKRICYPLSTEQFNSLESLCAQWLHSPYGVEYGEWWYNVFTREILLEQAVTDPNGSISYNFHVFKGEVAYISLFIKPEPGEENKVFYDTRLDSDFNLLPFQNGGCLRLALPPLADQTKTNMKLYAAGIGRQLSYARVDFLLDENENIYLGEVTFSPSCGFENRPIEFDQYIGNKWVHG